MKTVEISLVKELLNLISLEEDIASQFSILSKDRKTPNEAFLALSNQYHDACSKVHEFIKANRLPYYLNNIKAGNLKSKISSAERFGSDPSKITL